MRATKQSRARKVDSQIKYFLKFDTLGSANANTRSAELRAATAGSHF